MKDLKTSVEEIKTNIQQKRQAETQNKPMPYRKEIIAAQEELTGIRIRGVADPKDKNPRLLHELDLAVIQKILSHLIVAYIVDMILPTLAILTKRKIEQFCLSFQMSCSEDLSCHQQAN